jgi:alkanesulfonate monooxygenase SsuD/methylene tetrahydromethanopterin reductase-like flavin-dependent oxidoreductase (luciferase family)
MPAHFNLGMMFRCSNAPEKLVAFSQKVEQSGFDELWIVEDCFFAGGVASVATALATTQSITIGLGIMPAVVRNAAFTAMEIAALARLHPGRFLPGIGHGVGEWMQQIGAFPSSQLTALGEVTESVRALLAGELVDFQGDYVQLDKVKLDFPPQQPLPISLGVRGPKSLQLSGRVADGTILAEYASPEYVAWAREQIRVGQEAANREDMDHRVTVFAFCLMDEDRDRALAKLRHDMAVVVGSGRLTTYLAPMGIIEEVNQLLANGGVENLERNMPDEWLAKLAIVGTPGDCQQAIQALVDAGADSVVLVPYEDNDETHTQIINELLPRFT